MNTETLVAITLVVVVTAIAMIPVMRYIRRTEKAAKALAAKGWRCVGYDLFTGPVMIPPDKKDEQQ